MKLTGRLVKNNNIVKEKAVEKDIGSMGFRDALEECLISLCKELEIPVPLWLKKNTTEFARFQKTWFDTEQFIEKIRFDRFEIKLEQ